MRRTWRKAKPKPQKRFYINEQIRAKEVFLIDDEGEQIGEMTLKEAMDRAIEAGLDLVEVNPSKQPPVVKIMDYGQFKYEREKKAHKQKVMQKKVETKSVRLSVRISSHDLGLRIDQATKFLLKGDKLKIDLILKGREKAHPDKAVEIINGFVTELETREGLNIVKEQDLTKQGGRFIMVLVNKKD
jgi:translation initiation factor IF-3